MQENDMTPLNFRIDEHIVVKAAWLNAERYNWRIFWFALIAGLLSAGYFIYAKGLSFDRSVQQILLTLTFTLVVAVLVFAGLRAVAFPMQARRNFRQQKALANDMQLSWTDDEFHYATGKSQTVMPFSDLHGYKTSEHVILLYLSDVLYYCIPIAAFGNGPLLKSFTEKLDKAGVRRR